MAKSHKKRSSKYSTKVGKSVNKGLKTAGVVAKGVVKETIPIVEKSVSAVYETIATGANLGIKSAKNIGKGVKNTLKKSKNMAGGSRRNCKKCRSRTHRKKSKSIFKWF
jgi:hypothetical protein